MSVAGGDPSPRGGSTYEQAGVDIAAGDYAVELIGKHARSTVRPEVLGGLGGFAGAFAPDLTGFRDPVLLSATDGVGTKLAIAQTLDTHDTVGIDLVAMVVDDLVCQGGEPLFLLDYIACGRLVPERIADIVAGIAEGCRRSGCALLGGETAEHPGVMDPGAYDLAAFAVGIVERGAMLGPERVRPGDELVGLASSGLHSNGFSLVRKIILDRDLDVRAPVPELGATLGETLLTPTRIHAPAILALARAGEIHAAAHITGGGIAGNLTRVLPEGCHATLRRGTWEEPAIFDYLRRTGRVPEESMRSTYNLGLGMIAVVPEGTSSRAIATLEEHGETATSIGSVATGERGVTILEP